MEVRYARTPFPTEAHRVIFLAGPTPRSPEVQSWRGEALALLRDELGFTGTVYVPEDEGGGMHGNYEEQIVWEVVALRRSDVVVFWIPRDMATMPGLTTNDEFGWLKGRTRVVLGAPRSAAKVRYQIHHARKLKIPVRETLRETLQEAVQMVGPGAERRGSDVMVPAHVFATSAFQVWKAGALTRGNNVLLDLQVRDIVCLSDGKVVFWTIWVKVAITEEDGRVKQNEIVVGRSDLSSVVVWCRDEADIMNSKLVLVEEFRPAGGKVLELPGGSQLYGNSDALDVALEELHEELIMERKREDLVTLGTRRIAPTIAPHRNHAFAVAVSPETIAHYEKLSRENVFFGVEADMERTYVRVKTIREVFASQECCWTTLGIISTLLHK